MILLLFSVWYNNKVGQMKWARLDGQEDSSEIGVDDVLPLLQLHAHNEAIASDASVVDQHIHCPPLRHRLLEQPAPSPST